jgi:hypothetical protein
MRQRSSRLIRLMVRFRALSNSKKSLVGLYSSRAKLLLTRVMIVIESLSNTYLYQSNLMLWGTIWPE